VTLGLTADDEPGEDTLRREVFLYGVLTQLKRTPG